MFDYVGEKIQIAGKVFCWIGIAASVISGLFMIFSKFDVGGVVFAGFLVILLGSLSSWIISLFLIGFGELVENTSALPRSTITLEGSNLAAYAAEVEKKEEKETGWVCPNCGCTNDQNARQCKTCLKYR